MLQPPNVPPLDRLKSLVSSLSPAILGDTGSQALRAAGNDEIFRFTLD